MNRRYLVVGAGIAGLSAAIEFVSAGADVTVVEASPRVGGKLRSSSFAGIDGIDEGADAYLTRVAPAVQLASTVGVDPLKHPASAHAAVWNDGLHRLPPGIMLGVPASFRPIVTTRLLSWRGKARALADLVLPRTPIDDDRLGPLIRRRFGDEVHERLIDSLVGSIYAADTDHYSLATVPQLATLAEHRSLALAARRRARTAANASPTPIFAAPMAGMEALAEAARGWLENRGARIVTGTAVETIERGRSGWRVDLGSVGAGEGDGSDDFAGVVIATPAEAAATILKRIGSDDAARLVGEIDAADVIMVRLRVPAADWPERLVGLSGYLVPKPAQKWVTAASFGSQKWASWRPENGDQVVRVSLGRDGLAVDHLDDDEVIECALGDLHRQLEFELQPTEVSITRWWRGFPQYRPHHLDRIAELERVLPPGIGLAGASYRGVGVPASVASGARAAYGLLTAR